MREEFLVPRNTTAAKTARCLCWRREVVWSGGHALSPGCWSPSGTPVITEINPPHLKPSSTWCCLEAAAPAEPSCPTALCILLTPALLGGWSRQSCCPHSPTESARCLLIQTRSGGEEVKEKHIFTALQSSHSCTDTTGTDAAAVNQMCAW